MAATSDSISEKQYGVEEHEVREQQKRPGEPLEAEWASFDRKMLVKMDLLLIPMVTMVYLLAFLDRANVGNARVVSEEKRYIWW